ncbi:hypothetical protein ES708_18736 [subsurface metagenome]
MTIITCPECGKELDSSVISFEAHARSHWGVEPRNISTLRNAEAQRRYNIIMDAIPSQEMTVRGGDE